MEAAAILKGWCSSTAPTCTTDSIRCGFHTQLEGRVGGVSASPHNSLLLDAERCWFEATWPRVRHSSWSLKGLNASPESLWDKIKAISAGWEGEWQSIVLLRKVQRTFLSMCRIFFVFLPIPMGSWSTRFPMLLFAVCTLRSNYVPRTALGNDCATSLHLQLGICGPRLELNEPTTS